MVLVMVFRHEWSIHGSDNSIQHSTLVRSNSKLMSCFTLLMVGKTRCVAKASVTQRGGFDRYYYCRYILLYVIV